MEEKKKREKQISNQANEREGEKVITHPAHIISISVVVVVVMAFVVAVMITSPSVRVGVSSLSQVLPRDARLLRR